MARVTVFILVFSACCRFTMSLQQIKPLVREKGTSESMYKLFLLSFWLFLIPPLLAIVAEETYILPTLPLFIAVSLPSIILARDIAPRINTGYDYIRRESKKVEQIEWFGYVGMGLVLVNYLLIKADVELPGFSQAQDAELHFVGWVAIVVVSIIVSIIAILLAVILISSRPKKCTPQELAHEIDDVIDLSQNLRIESDPYRYEEFDLAFVRTIKDKRLDDIRLKCKNVAIQFPPRNQTEYCAPEGINILKEISKGLREAGA